MSRASTAARLGTRIPTEALAYAGLTFATLGWASAFVMGKIIVSEMAPLSAAAWRYGIAAVLLLPFAWRGRAVAGGLRGARTALVVMIACGGVLYPWLFLAALQYTSATNTSLLVALSPVMTILLAPLIGESLSRARVGGAALALGGAGVVITRADFGLLAALSANPGDLIALAAAASWAAFNLASRRVVARLSPAATNFAIYALGALVLFGLAVPEQPVTQLARSSALVTAGIFGTALLSSVLAGQCFLIGVRVLGVGRTVVFIYLVPVLTALLSASFLGEELALPQLLGGAAVLGGLYWFSRAPVSRSAVAGHRLEAPAERAL